jgi:tetrapyrrole methylase family protein/MazG family protein
MYLISGGHMSDFSTYQKALSVLGLDVGSGIYLIDAAEFETIHVPLFSPETPVLIDQVNSQDRAGILKKVFLSVYPAYHLVKMVHDLGTQAQRLEEIPLSEIDKSPNIGVSSVLFLPPLAPGSSLERFQEIMAHLRAPDGCPWDREQTHLSLRKYLLEEAYETLDALDAQDPRKISEELGDLFLQIVFHAQIASENGEFNMADIIKGIHDKLVRRHPHVFGDVLVDGAANVLQNWEIIKAEERIANGEIEKSLLDGLPAALPALIQAQEYQSRAARVGFDWPEIEGVLEKIREEIDEIIGANNHDELTAEMGDLLFALVNLARWKKIDAEAALRETNIKFKRRFGFVQQGARHMERPIQELSLDEMEALWQEAKKNE